MKTLSFASFALLLGAGLAFASAELTVKATNYAKTQPQVGKTIILKGARGSETSAVTNARGEAYFTFSGGDTYSLWCESFNGEFDCGFGNTWQVPKDASGEIEIFYDDDKFELKGVNFETGKATLLKSSYKALAPTVAGLLKYDTVKVEISGHTDNQGGAEYNQKLSEARAASVRDYLISKGIAPGRITAVGYGFTRPVASNDTESGRHKNRRIEIGIAQ